MASLLLVALPSCEDSVAEKREKIESIEQEIEKMRREISEMKAEKEAVGAPAGESDRKVAVERNIQIQEIKKGELDAYIDALTIRKEGLKVKLEAFRANHPVE